MGPGPGIGWGMAQSVEALRSAADFDRALHERMIADHRMGVRMASHPQQHIRQAQLRALEQEMVRVQSEEIRLMEQWLGEWFKQKPPA